MRAAEETLANEASRLPSGRRPHLGMARIKPSVTAPRSAGGAETSVDGLPGPLARPVNRTRELPLTAGVRWSAPHFGDPYGVVACHDALGMSVMSASRLLRRRRHMPSASIALCGHQSSSRTRLIDR